MIAKEPRDLGLSELKNTPKSSCKILKTQNQISDITLVHKGGALNDLFLKWSQYITGLAKEDQILVIRLTR